jgi:hypothetical protein
MAQHKTYATLALAMAGLVTVPSLAFADTIVDSIEGSATVSLVGGSSTPGTATVRVNGGGGDGDQQCNIDSGEAALVLDIITPRGVTASPAQLQVTQCQTDYSVSFTAAADAASGSATARFVSGPARDNGTAGTADQYNNNVNIPITVSAPAPTVTAPTVSHALNPATPNGLSGWYKSAVGVDWTVTGTSPTTSGCDDVSVSTDGEHRLTCSASNSAGTASDTASFKIDATAPLVSYTSAAGTAGNDGWYKSAVTATFTGTDDTSGPATATQTATSSGDGAAVTVSSPAFSDVAGNTRAAGAASQSFKVDTVAPSVSYTSATGTVGSNGWYKSAVTATFTGTDATSGPATATQTATSSGDGAAVTVSSPAFSDVAGNTQAGGAASQSFAIDTVAPSVSANQSNTTWSNAASVTSGLFTASDATSGIADADKNFTLTASAESTKDANGVIPTTVTRDVTDAAGHTTTRSFSALIDRGAPTVSLVGGPANGATLYTTQVQAPTCSGSDALSGLATCVISGYSGSAGTHTVTATATDNAGNTAAQSSTYTVRDMTHTGFYSPVTMGASVLNTVKGGSTVPLKFNVQIDGVQQDSTAVVTSFTAAKVSCTSGTPDAVDFVTTGSTALRWDATAGQFIQNWKTPTDAGTCYKATATLADGDTITALFQLK